MSSKDTAMISLYSAAPLNSTDENSLSLPSNLTLPLLCALDNLVVVKRHILDAVDRDGLDNHALEVDR